MIREAGKDEATCLLHTVQLQSKSHSPIEDCCISTAWPHVFIRAETACKASKAVQTNQIFCAQPVLRSADTT